MSQWRLLDPMMNSNLVFKQLSVLILLAAFSCSGLEKISSAAVFPLRTAAVDHAYYHSTWDYEDGLPQNTVLAVLQTSDGYLWLGTLRGLARFDGLRFAIFDQKNVPEIKDRAITCLCETPDGSLWFGTGHGGLNRFKKGNFFHYGKSDGLIGESIQTLFQGDDGTLWISTTNGVCSYKEGKFSPFSAPDWTAGNAVRSIGQDAGGSLWFMNTSGLHRVTNGVIETIPPLIEGRRRSGISVLIDHTGNFWMGTMDGLTCRKKDGTFTSYTTKEGLPNNIVNALLEDRDGN
ncbi:MAG: two-component regulator propeller domain-containing protein, partial [Verrucomicrobiota bacterium]